MERKEAYEQIKKLGLQGECQKKCGKNFTQCKTSELEEIIKTELAYIEAKEIKPAEVTTKATTKIEEPKDSFNKLLAILKERHILLESDIKKILE